MECFMYWSMLKMLCLLSGPIALIISIIALNRAKEKSSQPQPKPAYEPKPPQIPTIPVAKPTPAPTPAYTPTPPPLPVFEQAEQSKEPQVIETEFDKYIKHEKRERSKELGVWEQKIGTRWLLVAGIITVFVGVGYFLKFAYDNFSMGPQGRVIAVTIFGLIALLAGEITRRQGFGFVAKGVTALGFAILYAAVFSAYQIYNLIGYVPACSIASIITIGAMVYAVVLDEVFIAFLSLLGGFTTPAMVLLKVVHPTPLFVYVLILGCGAMVCSYYRRWRAINLLAFAGTFGLFARWFYTSLIYATLSKGGAITMQQFYFVIGWLGLFSAIYLVMPVLYGLAKKTKARTEEVCLILANAAVTLYFLSAILFDWFRDYLALMSLIMATAHLLFAAIVYKRCKEDTNLRMSLQAIGLFCVTLAVPLYFKLDATTATWSLEAAVLTYIGLRYKSILTQAAGLIVMTGSIGYLLLDMPSHGKTFNFILNAEFGRWVLVSASIFVIHLMYRKNKNESSYAVLTQLLYGISTILLFIALWVEWHFQILYGLSSIEEETGRLVIFAGMLIMFMPRFIKPEGKISEFLSWVLIMTGSAFCIVALNPSPFPDYAFWNIDFTIVMAFLAVMFIYQIRYRKISNVGSQILYSVFELLLLLTFTSEWAYYCGHHAPHDNLIRGSIVIFAAGVLLFVIRPLTPKGVLPKIAAVILAVIGAGYTIYNFEYLNRAEFRIFLNINFLIAAVYIIGLFLAARFTSSDKIFKTIFSITGVVMLWIILTMEIYLYWQHKTLDGEQIVNWQFMAQMCISIAWALYAFVLMVLGFLRNNAYLRYISFMIFGVLLAKVFLVDTHEIKNIYRVAAFLMTGITLLGVSYLYQYLRKNGFFDTLFLNDAEKKD
jgi:uncharacterized membrane protein